MKLPASWTLSFGQQIPAALECWVNNSTSDPTLECNWKVSPAANETSLSFCVFLAETFILQLIACNWASAASEWVAILLLFS